MGVSWVVPGPVRVAVAVDAGIATVYGLAATIGVPGGRLGSALVAGEAAVWAAVVLAWVFPTFWAGWSIAVNRLFLGTDEGDGDDDRRARPLPAWPSPRSMVVGASVLTALILTQATLTNGTGVAFRSVVAAYVVAAAAGAALLAIAADVLSLLAATRRTD